MDLNEIIRKKNLNKRQTEFVKKIVKKGGEFNNRIFKDIWGTTLPSPFKKKLLTEPSILKLIQERPQKYIVSIDSSKTTIQKIKTIEPSISIQKKPAPTIDSNLAKRLSDLENRISVLEKSFKDFMSPIRKIKLKSFKDELYKQYRQLNPHNDISGIDLAILKRRTCRELQISHDYFEDLIYDLKANEGNITIQMGRDKRYIQIKNR